MDLNYFETIKQKAYAKQVIKKSRFFVSVQEVIKKKEVRDALKEIAHLYPDATHQCWAYCIRLDGEEFVQFSDAGEPANSAGAPILRAIKHKQLTNVLVIVTRYFGGIKLGISGLIDAYYQSALLGLQAAGKVKKYALRTYIIDHIEYSRLGSILQAIESKKGIIVNIQYQQQIQIKTRLPDSSDQWLRSRVNNVSQGESSVRKEELCWYKK